MVTIRDEVQLPTKYGAAKLLTFNNLSDGKEHVAVVFGDQEKLQTPLVRIHSECLTGDAFGSLRCDCGAQLDRFMKQAVAEGGVLLYLRQEGRGIGLYNKIAAYRLQEKNIDTFEANRMLGFNDDERTFSVAAEILKAMKLSTIRLVTNNPDKIKQIEAAGITVSGVVQHSANVCKENYNYLKSKQEKGHFLLMEIKSANA